MPIESSIAISVVAARFVLASASARTPIGTPRVAPPLPSAIFVVATQPAFWRHPSSEFPKSWISNESPNSTKSATIPWNAERTVVSRFFCWSVSALGASLASSCSRASFSLSAASVAEAARSFAFAMSRRNPSAFAPASAASRCASGGNPGQTGGNPGRGESGTDGALPDSPRISLDFPFTPDA
jgi:hypothetical protein